MYAGTVKINLNDPEYSHLIDQQVGKKMFMPGMSLMVCIRN